MQTWMVIAALVIVALPVVLMLAFNGPDRSDARGRRLSHDWYVRAKKI